MGTEAHTLAATSPGVAIESAEASSRASAGRVPASRTRVRLLAALVLGWALLYLLAYVPGRGNGSDFQVFYAGAVADRQGANPFAWPQLWRVEQVLYDGGVGKHGAFIFAPYGDPPPFALLLRPLTALAESDAYRLWALLLLGCGGVGAYLALANWPARPRRLAALLVAVSPAALFDLRLGQNSTPLLLSLGLALWLGARGNPALAGAALATGMVKPHLMLPVALIVMLAAPGRDRRPMAMAFLLTTAAFIGIGVVFDGGWSAYGAWLGSVRGFGDTIRHQPDLASVPGFYLGSASATLSGVLNLGCLALAALLVWRLAVAAWRGDAWARERLLGGGIAVSLALSPYVHTSDQVLLAIPLLVLIRADGSGLRDTAVLLAAMTTLLAPMVVLRDYHTVGINALPPITVALAYALRRPLPVPSAARRRSGSERIDEAAHG